MSRCLNCGERYESTSQMAGRQQFCSSKCRRESGVINWYDMIRRCTNPRSKMYWGHGAKGITVCDRYMEYLNFWEDLGTKPGPKYTIDRYPDPHGNYDVGNIRWATRTQQNHNKVNSVLDWSLVDEIRRRDSEGETWMYIAYHMGLEYHQVRKVALHVQWKEEDRP